MALDFSRQTPRQPAIINNNKTQLFSNSLGQPSLSINNAPIHVRESAITTLGSWGLDHYNIINNIRLSSIHYHSFGKRAINSRLLSLASFFTAFQNPKQLKLYTIELLVLESIITYINSSIFISYCEHHRQREAFIICRLDLACQLLARNLPTVL